MTERKTQPELIRRIWMAIKKLNSDKKSSNVKNLFQILSNDIKITAENLETELAKAVDEELVINSNKANTSGRILYQIPTIDKTNRQKLESEHDWYCYLCHTGENVVKCAKCPRGLHTMCASYNDEESQDSEPENENSTINSSSSNFDVEITSSIHNSSINDDEVCIDNSWLPFVVLKKESLKLEENELDETKPIITDDCQFVSVVRQPAKRKTRDIKKSIVVRDDSPEPEGQIEETNRLNLSQKDEIVCQHCKLFSQSTKNQAPNVTVSELNSLLGFLFERIKPWINFGASPASKPFTKELQKIFTSLFLKCPVTLDSMKIKLSTNAYKTLDEFYGDIMDFHHCVAIIYGTKSKEYYTSQQTKLECNYHITEIRSCHDCYRHSNQLQTKSLFWFTEPCTIRHELVFAKQVGFSYWPAKVLKVVDDNYDVRFFGPKHTRAIVKANYIKSIDTSLEELKISKKTTGFVKAMEELEIYQQRRLNDFNGDYSNILSNNSISVNTSMVDNNLSNGVNSSPSSKSRTIKNSNSHNTSKINLRNRNKQLNMGNEQVFDARRSPPILVLNQDNSNKTNSIKSINIDKNYKIMLDNIKTALNAIPMGVETRKQILRSVEQEVDNLTVNFKTLLRQVKKGEWCYVCGKIGKYYCCLSIFYCSIECQHKHWNEEHINNCRKTI